MATSQQLAVRSLVHGIADSLSPSRSQARLREEALWGKVKALPEEKARAFMACAGRLSRAGLSDKALVQVAIHYVENHAKIQNPFAYYSKRGFATTNAAVKVQVDEHRALQQQDRDFFARRR